MCVCVCELNIRINGSSTRFSIKGYGRHLSRVLVVFSVYWIPDPGRHTVLMGSTVSELYSPLSALNPRHVLLNSVNRDVLFGSIPSVWWTNHLGLYIVSEDTPVPRRSSPLSVKVSLPTSLDRVPEDTRPGSVLGGGGNQTGSLYSIMGFMFFGSTFSSRYSGSTTQVTIQC